MRILGIDPGSRTGWALLEAGERLAGGTWDLGKLDGGARLVRLQDALRDTITLARPDLVAYEVVMGHGPGGSTAAHLYGALVGVLLLTCARMRVAVRGVHVGTAKKLATGSGKADKRAMVRAARDRWGLTVGHDEADALWIALAASN